jgi:hypothetical protein
VGNCSQLANELFYSGIVFLSLTPAPPPSLRDEKRGSLWLPHIIRSSRRRLLAPHERAQQRLAMSPMPIVYLGIHIARPCRRACAGRLGSALFYAFLHRLADTNLRKRGDSHGYGLPRLCPSLPLLVFPEEFPLGKCKCRRSFARVNGRYGAFHNNLTPASAVLGDELDAGRNGSERARLRFLDGR